MIHIIMVQTSVQSTILVFLAQIEIMVERPDGGAATPFFEKQAFVLGYTYTNVYTANSQCLEVCSMYF